MKILDIQERFGRPRQDSPDTTVFRCSISFDRAMWLLLEENAKANFRTIGQEIRFRLTRDLQAELAERERLL